MRDWQEVTGWTSVDASVPSGEASFAPILAVARRLAGAEIAQLLVLSDRKGGDGFPATERRGWAGDPLLDALARHVAARGVPLAVADAGAAGDRNAAAARLPAGSPWRAYRAIPVRAPDARLLAVIGLADRRPRPDWAGGADEALDDLALALAAQLVLGAELAERREAAERAGLVLREMEHRVKNSLSTVQAMIVMSLKAQAVPEAVRRSLLDRVASLSQTHSLILEGPGATTTLDALLDAELSHYAAAGGIGFDGPVVRIVASEAVTLGMAIHELATNAAKYGALSSPGGGRLRVRWLERLEAGERRLRLDWRETLPEAATLPPGERAGGFGTTLLETLIVRQQGGRIEREWASDGLKLSADVPLIPA